MTSHLAPWMRVTLRSHRPPPSARVAALWLAGVLLVGLVAPMLGYPVGADVDPARAGLGLGHGWGLGTDHLGRDVLARLALGTSAFVLPALLASCVAIGIGVPIGLMRSARPGLVADLLRLPIQAMEAVPPLVLVVLVLAVWGNTMPHLAWAAGIALAPRVQEAVYLQLQTLQRNAYVRAMRAHGVPELELWVGHLLIGAAGPAMLRELLRGLGFVLVIECTLSYLGGLGVQEPWPSWGNMLVFEWGRSWGAGVWAPVAALSLTLWACATAGAGREASHDG